MPENLALTNPEIELGVSEFVALLNQALEYTFGEVLITGELANLRVSKNKWVYFDLKDDASTVKFFGTVYNLPGPLEDGMLLRVRGVPKLHNLYGFSVNVVNMQPVGEGTIRRAAQLLQSQLDKEGLFDKARKRQLLYPPRRIGLITSRQSAAYADFMKILNARWQGLEIELIDVQVQGEIAPLQITRALEQFNAEADPPDILVLIRGGGSAEDLAAFSTEAVTRAVAASRVPTLAAIGHEIDLSLAELAADLRASTPSNAAELLVPDKTAVRAALTATAVQLEREMEGQLKANRELQRELAAMLHEAADDLITNASDKLQASRTLLAALNPQSILRRGYAIIRKDHSSIRSAKDVSAGDIVEIEIYDGSVRAAIQEVEGKDAS